MATRESLIEALESAKFEFNLARAQCRDWDSLAIRAHRSCIQAARAVVEAVDIGFEEVWPTGWWNLWAIRAPHDSTRPTCKFQIGSTTLDVIAMGFGSGVKADGNLADDTLLSLWRNLIGVCLRSRMTTAKGSAGQYDFPRIKTNAEGLPVDENAVPIRESGKLVATEHDDHNPTQALEYLRNQIADWVDMCSEAISILKVTDMRSKIEGECARLEAPTWGELSAHAKIQFDIITQGYEFQNALIGAANAWVDLLTTELDDNSKIANEHVHAAYGKRVNTFCFYYQLAAKLWNEDKENLFSKYKETIVPAKMEQFYYIQQLMQTGPISSLRLRDKSYFTGAVANEFRRLLSNACDENGIERKPFTAIELVHNLEMLLLKPSPQPIACGISDTSQPSDDSDGLDFELLPPSERRDFTLYLDGCNRFGTDLVTEVYNLLKKQGEVNVTKDTFRTNVSKARRKTGNLINKPRIANPSRSVINAESK